MKVGMLRLKTVWPFPRDIITKLSKKVNKIIVVEMNLGQIYHVVKEFSVDDCEVILAPKVGGEMHLPHELMEYLEVKS